MSKAENRKIEGVFGKCSASCWPPSKVQKESSLGELKVEKSTGGAHEDLKDLSRVCIYPAGISLEKH